MSGSGIDIGNKTKSGSESGDRMRTELRTKPWLESSVELKLEPRAWIGLESMSGIEVDIDRYERLRHPLYVHAGGAAGINNRNKPPTRNGGTATRRVGVRAAVLRRAIIGLARSKNLQPSAARVIVSVKKERAHRWIAVEKAKREIGKNEKKKTRKSITSQTTLRNCKAN
ncbi:hypothetical protein EVAR_61588_1 [Eumeta japonica]|uniref:Uncharacterized protein n=1 Tax=Eumeta variegata TaxID=151549 RepID=A0A4C1YJB7_EUMVA|nr:hypothetical protein EVAR_61588_1 [Eumeta japonica]